MAMNAATAFQKARRVGDLPASRRKPVTKERVKEAADIYRANFDDKPIEHVCDEMGIGRSMADRLIRLARQPPYSFLGPATPGKKSL